MAESDAVPAEWAKKSEEVNEIWVPSSFLVPVFEAAGVKPSKLRVVPEQVDVHIWDPDLVDPLPRNSPQLSVPASAKENDFIFLSSFKWEFVCYRPFFAIAHIL